MSTKKEVKTTMIEDPVKRLEWLEAQKQELVSGFEDKLFKSLTEAANTFKTIKEKLGKPDVLKDPKFFDVVTTLGIGTEEKTTKTKISGGERKPRIDLSIREWLTSQGAKTEDEIVAKFSAEGADKVKSVLKKRSAGDRPVFKFDNGKYAAVIKV